MIDFNDMEYSRPDVQALKELFETSTAEAI